MKTESFREPLARVVVLFFPFLNYGYLSVRRVSIMLIVSELISKLRIKFMENLVIHKCTAFCMHIVWKR